LVHRQESASQPDFEHLLERIRAGDSPAAESLRAILAPGVRFLLARSLGGDDIDAIVRETFHIVIEGIRGDKVCDSRKLLGYVREVVHFQARLAPRFRPEPVPEERLEQARGSLRSMPARDREALIRFYLLGQEEKQILAELQLSQVQFRALKANVRARVSPEPATAG